MSEKTDHLAQVLDFKILVPRCSVLFTLRNSEWNGRRNGNGTELLRCVTPTLALLDIVPRSSIINILFKGTVCPCRLAWQPRMQDSLLQVSIHTIAEVLLDQASVRSKGVKKLPKVRRQIKSGEHIYTTRKLAFWQTHLPLQKFPAIQYMHNAYTHILHERSHTYLMNMHIHTRTHAHTHTHTPVTLPSGWGLRGVRCMGGWEIMRLGHIGQLVTECGCDWCLRKPYESQC